MVRGLAGRCTDALQRGWSRKLPPIGKLAAHRQLDIIHLVFDEKQTEALIHACRTEKVTLNGILCSTLLLAVREEFDAVGARDGKDIALPVISAVNMRQWLAKTMIPQNAPGMFAPLVFTIHRIKAFVNAWDLAREVNKQLAVSLGRGAAHMAMQLASLMARWLTADTKGTRRVFRLMSAQPHGPFVTNLGAIDPPQTAAETAVRSLSFAIAPLANFPLLVAADSWAGKLFINLIFDKTMIDRIRAEGIMERIRKGLLVDV